MVRRRRKYELELEPIIVVIFENLPLFFILAHFHSLPPPQGFSFGRKKAKKTTMTPSAESAEIHPDSIPAEVAMTKTEVEVPSVAPSDSSYTNSLIDDESFETEDQTLKEWSMFPNMVKLIATFKSTKNCNIDIKPEEIGDEWLDFVDKKIMPALKTSVACGDIDDGFLSVDESTAVLTAVSTNCEELEVEETVLTAVSTNC